MTGSVYSVRVKGLRWGAVGIRRREAPEPTAPHLLANVTFVGVRGWLVGRSEERRVGKDELGVDLGGRRIIKKSLFLVTESYVLYAKTFRLSPSSAVLKQGRNKGHWRCPQ